MTLPTKYMSRKSIAEYFDTSETTVRRWIANGTIPPPERIGENPTLERWEKGALLRHMGRKLDQLGGSRAASEDPDEAVERMVHAAREGRSSHARRRHDQGIPLPKAG